MPRALLSVSDKTDLVPFAQTLAGRGYELVSTGGTARALESAGVPVTGISAVTSFPEIMDGRVKTLHPAVHGGILARRGRTDDMATLAQHRITPIDIVVVNLYPFVKAAAKPDIVFDALVEEIDIGGPSMVRSAAKNFQDVLVVVDPSDYPRVLGELEQPGGGSREFRFELARKAFAHTAAYDTAIAGTLAEFSPSEAASRAPRSRLRIRRGSLSHSAKSKSCATARIRISPRRGTPSTAPSLSDRRRSFRAKSCRTRT